MFFPAQCLRPEFSSKLLPSQETRILDLINGLIHALDEEQAQSEDQATPRRSYAKFLSQLLTARLMGRERDTVKSPENVTCPPPTPELAAGPAHAVPVAVESKSLDLLGSDVDLSFMNAWDAHNSQHAVQTTSTLLGFSETEYMQAFMAFPDQTWFME